jgi:CRP/FNR family transcriptional regulator
VAIRIIDRNDLIGATLRRVDFFAPWPAEVLTRMAVGSQLWRFAKGETLYEAGTPVRGIFVLVDGSVIDGRISSKGRAMATSILRPGWPLGVRATWTGDSYGYTGTARSDLTAVLLPRAKFREAVLGDPTRLEALIDFFCTQIAQDMEGLRLRGLGSPRCVMAGYLAYLSRPTFHVAADDPGAADPTAFDITQDELAAILFSARQTVNRMMKAMEREGVLQREGNRLRIVDFLKLLAVMEENEPIHPAWREQIVAWDAKLKALAAERLAAAGKPAQTAPASSPRA